MAKIYLVTFLRLFTYKMAAKSTGIDMEQNYVTVT